MNLVNYIEDTREIVQLAQLRDVGPGMALLKVLTRMRDAERRELEEEPKLGENDIKQDLRYRLGGIATANLILSLPDRAREIIEATEKGGITDET